MVAAVAAHEDGCRRSGTGQGTEMSNRVLNDECHVTILVEGVEYSHPGNRADRLPSPK